MTDVVLEPLQTLNSESLGLRVVMNNSKHNKLARLVTLVSNMKKSPWLLSRCSKSVENLSELKIDSSVTVTCPFLCLILHL